MNFNKTPLNTIDFHMICSVKLTEQPRKLHNHKTSTSNALRNIEFSTPSYYLKNFIDKKTEILIQNSLKNSEIRKTISIILYI